VTTIQPEISIVAPAYNEAANMLEFLERVVTATAPVAESFEVVVIDDGSSDNTWEILLSAQSTYPQLQALKLSRNFGKELALCAGLESAAGQAVVILDTDLQHPPELIRSLVARWKKGDVDLVEAVKDVRGSEPVTRKAGAAAFYKTLHWLTGFDLTGASDYKLLDRKVVDAWMRLPERNVFFRGMSAWLGFKRDTITFSVQDREAGESRWTAAQLVQLAINSTLAFSSVPIRFIFAIGVLFLFVAAVLALRAVQLWATGQAAPGFTTVILLQLFIGGLVLTSLGIIGKYISLIYSEVKGRPRYIVSSRIGRNVAPDTISRLDDTREEPAR
jgi:glycosyltransferase involved in cell wall biosynthesis